MIDINNYIQEALISKKTKIDVNYTPPEKKKRIYPDINYYACYANKSKKEFLCYSLGSLPKSKDGRAEAEKDAKNSGHPNENYYGGKWKGVLNRDQVSRKCPSDYNYVFV